MSETFHEQLCVKEEAQESHRVELNIDSMSINDNQMNQLQDHMIDNTILNLQHLKKGLHSVGCNPLTLKYSYLHVNLSSNHLSNIDLLSRYKNLVNIDISNNSVSTLKILENIPMLTTLIARKNELVSCLDFSPLHCTAANAWSKGCLSVGSMLTYADLSENKIEELVDIKQHRYLECLLLSMNSIKAINGIQDLQRLMILDLSNNQLTSIENLSGLSIQELNLAENHLHTLEGLSGLKYLRVLNVAYNSIQDIQPLSLNTALQKVSLLGNKIRFIRKIEQLQSLSALTSLELDENPCSSKPFYRLRCLYLLPRLLALDRTNASPIEKLEAFNLYRSEEGELGQRKATHDAYLAEKPFEDHSYKFKDDEVDSSQ